MSRLTRLLALALFACFSLSALDPTPQESGEGEAGTEGRPRSYTLESGRSVRGTILASEGSRVRLRLLISGGTSERWFQFGDFDAKSQVRLRHEMVEEGDVVAQLEVAELAGELGLYDQARTELKRCAYMADKTPGVEPAPIKDRALALTTRLLEAFCGRGDVKEARDAVSRLLTKRGSSLTEEEQARLIQTVETFATQEREAKAAARQASADKKAAAEREKKLAPVLKHISTGKEKRRKGLVNSHKYSAASRDLSTAIRHFEDALAEIEKLRKKHAEDRAMLIELDVAAEEAGTFWQSTLLSRASLDLARGKFNDAMEGVNTILADHPRHTEALAMRGRIELAQSDWGW